MEEIKKRKLEELGNGKFDLKLSQPTSLTLSLSSSSSASLDAPRTLLEPLAKPQLTDLLVKLYALSPTSSSSSSFFHGKKKERKSTTQISNYNISTIFTCTTTRRTKKEIDQWLNLIQPGGNRARGFWRTERIGQINPSDWHNRR